MTSIDTAGPPSEPAGRPDPVRPARGRLAASPAVKFFAIAFLTGLLLVPILMVWALTTERSSRREEVLSGIERDWGGQQVVHGPMLLVPYESWTTVSENGTSRRETVRLTAAFLPEVLDAAVTLDTSRRQVSIYEATVYNALVEAKVRFGTLDAGLFGPDVTSVDWDDAVLALRVSDPSGIEEVRASVEGAGSPAFEPGGGVVFVSDPVIHAPLPLGARASGLTAAGPALDLTLRLRGSRAVWLAPVGRETTVAMTSNWQHPGFTGAVLPSERTVGETGFTATWRVPTLARSTPQAFLAVDRLDMAGTELVGVRLDEPVDSYALVDRGLKYGIMFVATVFGIVFLLEILSPRRIHVVQYTLVGLIVVFFYVLLLALAEQVGFTAAYVASSTATGGVVAAFVGLALGSLARGATAALAFAGMFALLYAILTLEDVALLAGAIAGFLVLTIVLFATRRVDWTGAGRDEVSAPAPPAAPA